MAAEVRRNRELLKEYQRRKAEKEGQRLLALLPQGEGSGLNADLLDGMHAAEIIAKAMEDLKIGRLLEELRKRIRVSGGGGGMQKHGNEWHEPTFEEYGLSVLLDGSRPMTGPLKTDEIKEATTGHGVKVSLPNTSFEFVEHTITDWGLTLLLGNFTDKLGSHYGGFSNGLWLVDKEGYGTASIIFTSPTGSQYAYFEHKIGGDLKLYLTPDGAFRPYSGANISLGTLLYPWNNLFVSKVGVSLKPETSGSLDLGVTHGLPFLQFYWRNLYLSNTGYMATLDEISSGDGVAIPHAADITLLDDKFLKPGKDSNGSLPTPSVSYRGKIIRVEGGAGEADHTYICQKHADDSYYWDQLD